MRRICTTLASDKATGSPTSPSVRMPAPIPTSILIRAISLVYAFFSRIATPLFAAIVCAVFMTDYVLFAQWHVVTYRVWHCLLFFFCLYCTERAGESRNGKWIVGLLVGFF